ncbi:hypothetical protein SAMN05216559_1174 [Halomicrobium zhouii]|uniref:Uncharacterized protein n=1 Tax=Halomicrobium zhouii TaxID=767519 RepID=A0A1I6KNR8_9EURY|nr:hypothetical protein [Halomicrobium zhouii]SFR92892.1 hypothetical protein SAMN05216559_1174 [Halomicrobium zhouii]
MIGVIRATVGQALESRGVDASELAATLRYGVRRKFLALYAVVYLGLLIADWNVLWSFRVILYATPEPFFRTVLGLSDFLTSLVGYGIAAAGVVGVLKTVLEDTVGEAGRGQSESNR